jgi:hypothetical protein
MASASAQITVYLTVGSVSKEHTGKIIYIDNNGTTIFELHDPSSLVGFKFDLSALGQSFIGQAGSEVAGPADLDSPAVVRIRSLLAEELGSDEAAEAWLNSRDTGYPTTAMAAILAGRADLVLQDLENQLGPSPSYA